MPYPNIRKFYICRIFLTLIFFSSGICPGFSAPSPNYFIRTWQVENGLPQNKVTAVVQTRDGYLWLSTYNGLVRFDGVRFTVFDDANTPELRSSRVTSLFEAADGVLWIGDEGGHVTQYKQGRFKAVSFHANWSGGKIYGIAADESGDVWLMNEAGELARAKDGLVLIPPAGTVAKVVALTSAGGKIWVTCNGAVSALERGQLSPLKFNEPTTNSYVQGIGASSDGGLWVASDGRFRKWLDGRWVQDLGPTPWSNSIVCPVVEMRNGVLAIGTVNQGLYLIFPKNAQAPLHFDRVSGFPSDWVISLWEDREGNLWSGTGAGLVVMRPNNIETISPPDQWKGRAVLSVCPGQNGALWIGTEGAGLYRFQNGAWTNFNSAQGIRNPYIWSLAEDAGGKLWAGTWGGGLFVQNGDSFEFAKGMEKITTPMPALLSAENGLWVGTTSGLLRYQAGKAMWFNQNPGQNLSDVRAIKKDEQGTIWFGMVGNGLASLQDQKIRQFKKLDGLSSDFIDCLHFAKNGTLWIGTFGGGLTRFKNGHFSIINRQQGLPNNVIGDIEADSQGFFWMSSYGGIIRASEAELNRCADGETQEVHCLTYGINDGLPTLECSEGLQPAGCKTADGRLWFPTSKGLVSVNPTNVIINHLPPPVIIEEIRIDDQTIARKTADEVPLRISPGWHRLDFQYTGLSFVAPEKVQFKCRLNKFDADWINMGTKRVATYNYIPPGNYSFQVVACNNDGIWNETGASLSFDVLPYFWQTLWFRLSVLALLITTSGGLVWFDTRRSMRRKLERIERQRDIERERARIAHDIHDDLGAHLTRITMLSESVRGELADSVRAVAGLNQIYDTARELTRSMDEIVWAVNPRHDTLESLASYLEKFAQDLLLAADIRCRLDMPQQFPEWRLTSEVRHNVFLAFKEALHNVVKHSAASEAYIQLTVKLNSFILIVEDNGPGFTSEIKKRIPSDDASRIASGNGLGNMTRRLAEIGGHCEIQSATGKGTKITFTIRL
jgi:signal transduction histidine kinase/ligand-binding sensor domain-containing protein